MYKSEIKGKGGIVARVVAKSVSESGVGVCTMELEYPRFIHSEFMTHRQFSRNAASSRAIPVSKVIDQIDTNPAMPIHWGKNQAGMSANEECNNIVEFDWLCGDHKTKEPEDAWRESADRAVDIAKAMSDAGYHKQIVNRILEPYQFIKVVVTATEWDNFFELRDHPDAQPEIQELARCMKEAMEQAETEVLQVGEWHLPYVKSVNCPAGSGKVYYAIGDYLTTEEALKVSASCCAQVSYRLLDMSLEKALFIYDKLVTSTPIHASPFEHAATPMYAVDCKYYTHTDKHGNLWSGNFKGWGQYRQGLM